MVDDDDLMPITWLRSLAICERQFAIECLNGEWADDARTVAGKAFHERVDESGYRCRDGVRAERRVWLASHELGLIGIADIVEFDGDAVRPVEYKVGKPKVVDWDRVQLAAQAMCLEEMLGVEIPSGALFYGRTRRREAVEIEETLRERVHNLSRRMHEMRSSGVMPVVTRCRACRTCSLRDICLPETFEHDASAYWRGFGVES